MDKNAKNDVMKAADIAAGVGATEKFTSEVAKLQRTKAKSKNPFDKTLERARSIFKTQIDRGAKTKRLAIDRSINEQSLDYTKEQFLSEYVRRIGRLLDSNRFNKNCKEAKLDPFSVSTHVAFDGLKKTYNVLENGLVQEYYSFFSEMKEAVFTAKELKDFDTEDFVPAAPAEN